MIKDSIKAIINISEHQKNLEEYARSKYSEKFIGYKSGVKNFDVWHSYDGFTIISETKIQVSFKYGYGNMEYTDSFLVDVTEDDRDDIINEILK